MTQFDPSMVAEMLMSPIRRASENLGGGPMGIGADAGGSYFVDPEVAARTGYGTAVTGTSFFPGAGIVDAYGGAVDVTGQPLPSFGQNIGQGNYLDAALQGLGVAGDVATVAAPLTLGTSAVLGALLKAPGAARKVTKATDVASDASKGIRVFHGTNKNIDKFELGQESASGVDSDALFFSTDKSEAQAYGTNVVEADIDLQSPLTMDFGGMSGINFDGKYRTPSQLSKRIAEINDDLKNNFALDEDLLDELKIFGFDPLYDDTIDGVIMNNISDPGRGLGEGKTTTNYMVFDTEKISMPGSDVAGIAKVEPPTETQPGIIAFAGSGADFDEFKLEFIGTGEGAAAFGHGLYFSNSKDIGDFYKNALTRSVDIDGKPYIRGNSIKSELLDPDIADELGAANGDLELAIKNEEEYLQTLTGSQPSNTALDTASKETQKRIEKLKALRGRVKVNPTEGKTYKVAIQPKPEELLDYDLPLSEQSDFVKAKLKELNITRPGTNLELISSNDFYKERGVDLKGEQLYNLIAQVARERASEKVKEINKKLSSLVKIIDDNSVGYRNFTSKAGEDAAKEHDKLLTERSKLPNLTQGKDFTKIASELLSESGIKGLKFKAGQLSGRQFHIPKEKASENYVIFDDKIIKILEKYGIVGPVAVSAMAGALKDDDRSL